MCNRAIKNPSTVNGTVMLENCSRARKSDSAQWAELGVPRINRERSRDYLRQERCSQQLYTVRVRKKEESKNWMPGTETLKRDTDSFKWPITLEEKSLHKSVYLTEVPHFSLNEAAQNIHKGALKSIQGHRVDTVLIPKPHYNEHPQREDSHWWECIPGIPTDEIPGNTMTEQ